MFPKASGIMLAGVLSSTPAFAVESFQHGFSLQAGTEWYKWREYDAGGTQVLREEGPRWFAGASLGNREKRETSGLVYAAEARLYQGAVDYAASSGVALSSQTDYQGARALLLGGYRWVDVRKLRSFDLFGGIALDRWTRDINFSTTLGGATVSGMKETYRVAYSMLGAGIGGGIGRWRARLDAGLKRPFNTYEKAELMSLGYDRDVNLVPREAYSGFARLQLRSGLSQRARRWGVAFYYDGLRFAASVAKVVTVNGVPRSVWQPESHMDAFGMQIDYWF